jgi:hypothetical protein
MSEIDCKNFTVFDGCALQGDTFALANYAQRLEQRFIKAVSNNDSLHW